MSRFIYYYAECHYAEWRYAECRGVSLTMYEPHLKKNIITQTNYHPIDVTKQ